MKAGKTFPVEEVLAEMRQILAGIAIGLLGALFERSPLFSRLEEVGLQSLLFGKAKLSERVHLSAPKITRNHHPHGHAD